MTNLKALQQINPPGLGVNLDKPTMTAVPMYEASTMTIVSLEIARIANLLDIFRPYKFLFLLRNSQRIAPHKASNSSLESGPIIELLDRACIQVLSLPNFFW